MNKCECCGSDKTKQTYEKVSNYIHKLLVTHCDSCGLSFYQEPIINKTPSIACPTCKKRSYSQGDIDNRYCGHCHKYHAPKLLELKLIDSRDETPIFNLIYVGNQKVLGEIFQLEDGFFVFNPTGNGCWGEHVLRELVDHLEFLNLDIDKL